MQPSAGAVQLESSRRETPLPPNAPFYRKLLRGWQRIARWIGTLLSRTVTTLFYFIVVTPFAIGVRLGSDPLRLKPGPVNWQPAPPASDLEEARRGL
jgi:hypothetical protein